MTVLQLSSLLALPAFALGTAIASAAAVPGVIADVPQAAGISDLGRITAGSPIRIGVSLAYRHQPELDALVAQEADPDSPLYHRFLTRAQFDAYFAPTPLAYARVNASLRDAGFWITRSYANRTVIDASAPAATVERYFATELHRVAQPGVGIRYANVRPAIVPAEVRDAISGVVGLSNVGGFHTYNHRLPRERGVRPQLSVPGQLFGPDYGYGPTAYIDGYDIPTKKALGKGQVSAVVIDADFLDSDLAAYLQYFGVSRGGPPTVRVPIDGGPLPGLGSSDSVETTLDVETIVSLAPATSLYVYEFPDFTSDQYIIDAYQQVVIDDYAGTVNSSFGGCESADIPFTKMSDQIALQGAALGITFHASTGDSGSSSCPSTGVSSPASAPHFVAVGGTSLYLDPSSAKLQREFAWNGSGGGVSIVFPVPSNQKGVANVIASGRNLPDVSFDADPGTGESFYYGGLFQGPIGGTSLSSPIYGAAQTIANQLNGSEAGFVNPAIYQAFKRHGYYDGGTQLFRDITVGRNGFYAALPGYDRVTGIGPEIVGNLTKFVR